MLRNEVGACIGAAMGLLGLWGWVGCNAAAQPDPPAVALECEANGYPCSLSKVGLDVLMRGEELRDELVAMLDSNGSMDAALAFVRGQADVVDAASSDFALRFRLAGGRDMWVVRGDSMAPELASPLVDTTGAKAVRLPHVVGDTPESKHALVLSPFKYDFDVNDEGFALAQMLEGVRGYEGNVTYLSNVSAGSKEVGISNFLGWEGYDLIHVSSHGKTICQGENCSAVIFTGDRYANANQLLQITEAGVNTVAVTGSDIRLLAVGEDFFRQHYPGGLERTIVFFNACHTFGAEDMGLGLALAGSTSVFLGWNQPVMADAAYAAGLAFHRNLAEGGITATSAYRALDDLRYNNFKYKGGEYFASLLIVGPADRDLRAREVVKLEHPTSGGELIADATVEANGTADDGVADLVPYVVVVDGVEEGEADAVMVTVKVDGHASTPSAVSIGERVGDRGWRLSGEIPYIDVTTTQTVEMRAEVQLPEGGVSEHRVAITLTTEPREREVWIGETAATLDLVLGPPSQVTLFATVKLVQTEHSVGKPLKNLEVTEGTMTWYRSGAVTTAFDGDCAYSAGPIEVAIQPGDAEIWIDTTASPQTYTMDGRTEGPEVEVAKNCDNYAFTTSAGGSWAPLIFDGDGFTVSADGGLITGTTSWGFHTWTWTFTRQSK